MPEHLGELAAAAVETASHRTAPRTRRVYRSHWRAFRAWHAGPAELGELPADPWHRTQPDLLAAAIDPGVLVLYVEARIRGVPELDDLVDPVRLQTVRGALSAISDAHRRSALPSPTRDPAFRDWLKSARNRYGVEADGATPLWAPELRAAVRAVPLDSPAGVRDRAILLVGYADGFRRSELSGLDVADVVERPGGYAVRLRFSKTNRDGRRRDLRGVPYGTQGPDVCPVTALRAWLAVVPEAGPVFRGVDRHGRIGGRLSGRSVDRVVRRACARIGLDGFSAHSLRAGFVSSVLEAGGDPFAIARATGHSSIRGLEAYARGAGLFDDHPARLVL